MSGSRQYGKTRTFARRLLWGGCLASTASAWAVSGVESIYTQKLVKILNTGSLTGLSSPLGGDPLLIRGWKTPGNDFYIGVEQIMKIEAPLSGVAAVLSDVNHYAELFPGYKDIHMESSTTDRWETYWEQIVPLFFVPNVKYEMLYFLSSPTADRQVFRYQLKQPTTLRASDGFVLIQRLAPGETSYTELDFFDADWGPAKLLGKDKIWQDAVDGIYLSDIGIKLKSEHPDWSYPRIREESRIILKRYPQSKAVSDRAPFPY